MKPVTSSTKTWHTSEIQITTPGIKLIKLFVAIILNVLAKNCSGSSVFYFQLPQCVLQVYAFIVKNLFCTVNLIFSAFNVIDKCYSSVLARICYSQLLLKLPIQTSSDLKYSMHVQVAAQRNYSIKTGMNQFRRNKSSHDLDSCRTILKMGITKCALFLQQC